MKVSVIIAAYNAEKYISETLDSVANQTIGDYEVIVVDDGSTDQTPFIIKSYTENFSNIRMIRQENSGPSSARNTGLEAAGGDFIYFFDADDILELDALECLYLTARENNADLVIAKYDIFNHYRKFDVHSLDEILELTDIDKYNIPLLWSFSLSNKLFKRSAIEAISLRFSPVSYSEDGVFLMEYVYHCEKITGLDKIIFHYRRMYDGDLSSITAFVTSSKIHDYITAHEMILNSAKNSFLRDHPECGSINEAQKLYPEISIYLSEIIRKELQILFSQFYVKFWQLSEDIRNMITAEINDKLKTINMSSYSILANTFPELSLEKLYTKSADVLEHAYFTIALYGRQQQYDDFLACLQCLTEQNFIFIKILVPFKMKSIVQDSGLLQDNILFVDADSENALFHYALDTVTTPYITFCDAKIIYTNNTFKHIFKKFAKEEPDFISELIYHRNYGEMQPVPIHNIAYKSVLYDKEYNPYLAFDHTLANKFFDADFLKSHKIYSADNIAEYLETFYRTGYYIFSADKLVSFEDMADNFIYFIQTPQNRDFIKNHIQDKPVSLNDPEIIVQPEEIVSKLKPMSARSLWKKFIKKIVKRFQKQPF